jgi:signal transduction histidine kinase
LELLKTFTLAAATAFAANAAAAPGLISVGWHRRLDPERGPREAAACNQYKEPGVTVAVLVRLPVTTGLCETHTRTDTFTMIEEDEPASDRPVPPAGDPDPLEPRETELTGLDRALHDVERAKTEFVAGISREFRTPLALLLGPLQDILESQASALAPQSRTVLEKARRSALRLMDLLDAFPHYFRIDGRSPGIAHEPSDLAGFTAQLAGNFGPFCEAAGLRLIVDSPPIREDVDTDRNVWEKIVVNLVANAFTSTFEGAIEVRLRVRDSIAHLTVSDTGSGIPESELRYVFADSAVSRTPAGLPDRGGFGLAFVRELVQRQHGSIDVQSTPGRGTSFTVLLPVAPGDGAGNGGGVKSRSAAPASGGMAALAAALPGLRETGVQAHAQATLADDLVRRRGRVVIAEDHDETRLYLSHVLETAGFTVDALADGAAALAACQSRMPDAVVSDVLMPGLGGFELIERLRADERTAVIPVLLLSARGGEESRIEGIGAGADDFLVKPLSSRELVARVDGAVRLARLRRETARREQERIRELSGRLVEVQEAERRELSAELHDRTSPQLAAIQINLKMLNRLLSARDTEDVKALLDDTAGLIADTTLSIREISSNLRPTVLDDGGLLPALAGYAHQFTQRTGIAVHLDTAGAAAPLTAAVQSGLFRIAQEALTNCAKHSKARNVSIRLSADGGPPVAMMIADDGVGFDLEHQTASGLGLLTMRERAEFLGGRFSIETKPGQGTRIQVVV